MPKPKANTKLAGQMDLFASFQRQAQRASAATVKSKKAAPSTSLWNNLKAPAKTSVPCRGGKENATTRKVSTSSNEEEDEDEDIPLAALGRPSSFNSKGSVAKRKLPPSKATAKRASTGIQRKPKTASKKAQPPSAKRRVGCNTTVKSTRVDAPQKPSSKRKPDSNMDTALEFLQPRRKDKQPRRKEKKDLTLKDIESHLKSNKERKETKAAQEVPKPKEKESTEKDTVTEPTKEAPVVETTSETSTISTVSIKEIKSQNALDPTSLAAEQETDPADFDASQQTIPRSQNLLHQLLDRSLLGSRGRRISHGPRTATSLQVQRPYIQAKPANWIHLEGDHHNNQTQVDGMAWDPLGVLLAVANTSSITKQSWIEVYDWDTVCAADRQGRNLKARSQARQEKLLHALTVPPLLKFRIPSSASSRKISFLQWNPHHPDQLAVGRGQTVYCMNVSHVEAALATTANPHQIANPPRHAYWEFTAPSDSSKGEPASAGRFVDQDQLVVAFGTALVCYRFYPKRDPTSVRPKLKWQFKFNFKNNKSGLNRGAIVALETMGKEHLIAGSSHGHLALIQWKRVVAASATSSFLTASSSNRLSPTLVSLWLSYASLNEQRYPQEQKQDPSLMGIQNLQVEALSNNPSNNEPTVSKKTDAKKTAQSSPNEQLCGRFRIQWVTKCGWVLSLVLEASPSSDWKSYRVRREKPRLVYQTTPIETRLAAGVLVTTARKEWSLPTETIASDVGIHFLCWQKVAPVKKILPHHDLQVLDDQPSIVRDVKDSNQLLLLPCPARNWHCGAAAAQPICIALPRKRGLPRVVGVDPVNQEWAVVASSEGHLYVLNIK